MGGNRNAIAYGILKSAKVNTKGMSPKQAWQKVKELGLIGKAKSYGYTDDELDAMFDEVNTFHPTPDMERVIEKAKGVAKKVTVTTNAHENFEKAIDQLILLKNQYGFEMLEEIKTADWVGPNPASVSKDGKTLMISNRFLENPKIVIDNDIKVLTGISQDYQNSKSDFNELLNNKCEDVKLLNEAQSEYLENARKSAFVRCHIGINDITKPDDILKTVITHETGHILSARFSKDKKEKLVKDFQRLMSQYKAIENPQERALIHSVSLRATERAPEFFSELFVMFNTSDEMPEELHRIVTEALYA